MAELDKTEERQRLELDKLRAEIASLKRPWHLNPASWIAIATSIALLAGVIIQYVKSSNAYDLAQIESVRAKLAQEKAESAKTRLEVQNVQLEKHRVQLLGQVAQFEGQLRGLETRYRSESEKTKLIAQAEEAVGSLEALKVAVGERSALPAFAVVASFRSLERAKEHAKSLASSDRSYQVVVFRRAPLRYAVTLGGYLSYEEAANRVQHAKQLGIADAYVRLAKDWGQPVFTER
jgi:uncharacterized membrane-anchored protein YhcB (DUF1043 family)